jgi:hypothetical protein
MALVLAMFAASLAWGDEIVPDAAPAPAVELAPQLSMRRYRAGMTVATTGLVLMPVGFAVGVAGLYTVLVTESSMDPQFGVGITLVYVGGAAMFVGPPLTIIGSLTSAGALRRAGIRVTKVWAIAATAIYVGGLIVPPVGLVAVVPAALQMAADTSALHHSGHKPPKASATIVPLTVGNTHGLALVGSF